LINFALAAAFGYLAFLEAVTPLPPGMGGVLAAARVGGGQVFMASPAFRAWLISTGYTIINGSIATLGLAMASSNTGSGGQSSGGSQGGSGSGSLPPGAQGKVKLFEQSEIERLTQHINQRHGFGWSNVTPREVVQCIIDGCLGKKGVATVTRDGFRSWGYASQLRGKAVTVFLDDWGVPHTIF
jgi:hypothetical protein